MAPCSSGSGSVGRAISIRARPSSSRATPGATGGRRGPRRCKAIHARARRVYLLNPEPADEWDTTDSIVEVYRPYLDAVFEVRNLRQLAEAVLRIGMTTARHLV